MVFKNPDYFLIIVSAVPENIREDRNIEIAQLRELGRENESVDHRSLERQGIDREPGEHYGPDAAHLVERGYDQDRLAGAAGDEPARLSEVERHIDRLESVRDALLVEMTRDDAPGRGFWGGPSRDDGSRAR